MMDLTPAREGPGVGPRRVVLARHGATEWSTTGRHTGRTDLPLTEHGREQARALAPRLAAFGDAAVLVSPLSRALETAELAGLGSRVELQPELMEWDYGEYEGLRTREIHEHRPDWDLFRDGCPGGEDAAAVGRRVDAVIADLLGRTEPDVILVAHGHVLRVLTARWLELDPRFGSQFVLDTGTLSGLGYEWTSRALLAWNA